MALRDPSAEILDRVVRVACAEMVRLEQEVLLSFDCVGHVPVVLCTVGPTARSCAPLSPDGEPAVQSHLPPVPGKRRLRQTVLTAAGPEGRMGPMRYDPNRRWTPSDVPPRSVLPRQQPRLRRRRTPPD